MKFEDIAGHMCRCIPHTLYVGSSFMVWTSLALCAHHSFGAWHGDKRLQERYGEVQLFLSAFALFFALQN